MSCVIHENLPVEGYLSTLGVLPVKVDGFTFFLKVYDLSSLDKVVHASAMHILRGASSVTKGEVHDALERQGFKTELQGRKIDSIDPKFDAGMTVFTFGLVAFAVAVAIISIYHYSQGTIMTPALTKAVRIAGGICGAIILPGFIAAVIASVMRHRDRQKQVGCVEVKKDAARYP